MNLHIGAYTPADARAIKNEVLSPNRKDGMGTKFDERFKLGWHYVVLKEDLASATNPLTGYTQASAAVLMYEEGRDTIDMEEVTGTYNYIKITNRSTTFSASEGDLVLVHWFIKEWMPVVGSGGLLRHGIVSSSYGCGYYRIQLGTWNGDYTSSGSGIGSDNSSGIDHNCDICYDTTGVGTSSCGITLSYPPCPVTGIDEYVIAYHSASALVPLHVGSACKLANLGDTDAGTSGQVASTDAIWQIVDGLQDHVVTYEEVWSCCDGVGETGVETLLTRTPVVFAGKRCDPIPCGTCAVPSSGSV